MKNKFLVLITVVIATIGIGRSVYALDSSSIYNLNSSWITQSGASQPLAKFQGKPVVLAMIFTSCPAACPMLVADMQKIERRLPSRLHEQVQFVLVSFDSKRDDARRLQEFAKRRGIDKSNWTLLTGAPNDVRELAAVLNVQYKRTESGAYTHSNLITILDADGVVRYQQLGLGADPANSVKALEDFTESK